MTAPEQPTPEAGRFRKKPVVIEAIQFTPEVWKQCEAFGGGCITAIGNWKHENDVLCLHVKTLEGTMTATPGDWIVRGIKGEVYPCKPDIFDATYDPEEVAAQRAAEAVERERARCAWLAGDGCRSREELIAGIKGGETPEGKMRARWAAMLAAAPTCNETLQVQTPATPPPGDAGERAREITRALITMAGQYERPAERENRYVAAITAALQSERTAAASQARRGALLECAEIAKKHRSETEMERHKTPDQESKACWLWAFDTSNAIEREIRALATSQE